MIFNPGPAALPVEALQRTAREMVDLAGTGVGLPEHSHRGPVYGEVHEEAIALLRELLAIPDSHEVLLLQGGARQQFAMVPMNLLPPGRSADYLLTGHWSVQAQEEAALVGDVRTAVDVQEDDGAFRRIPRQAELELDPMAAYVHLTTNNTLYGTQWPEPPDTGTVPIVADMTSDLLGAPLDVSAFGLIYAAAQKNLGGAGVTVVIVRRDLIEEPPPLPKVFRYLTHASKGSLYATPPTVPIALMRNTLRVLAARGGLAALGAESAAKAARLYGALEAHPDLYLLSAEPGSRSRMNVVFRLPTPELEQRFLAAAEARRMLGLKGHRVVGGLRASLYHGVEPAWVEALAAFCDDFARDPG